MRQEKKPLGFTFRIKIKGQYINILYYILKIYIFSPDQIIYHYTVPALLASVLSKDTVLGIGEHQLNN